MPLLSEIIVSADSKGMIESTSNSESGANKSSKIERLKERSKEKPKERQQTKLKNCKSNHASDAASANDVPVLRRAAMDYLARREHSFFELKQKLSKKYPDTDEELLFEVLDILRDENLQSDERFTESYTRYRKSRGFAYLHIRADLSARQVSDSLINKYLIADEECWQISANELVSKKLRNQEPLRYGSKSYRKLSRFLESRGFSSQQISRALKKYSV